MDTVHVSGGRVAGQQTAPEQGTSSDRAAALAALPVDPGQCRDCRHALVKETNKGTAYLRCGRAAWDPKLVRYPRLPVAGCEGYEQAG
jgi:hypothetical protein